MSETEEPSNTWRAHVALRNRLQALDDRDHKLSMAIFGLLAYSAFANVLAGFMTLTSSPIDAGLGFVLGALYLLGVYRVWQKDDIRWWPVAVPAGISIALLLLAWFGGLHRPIPILLNVVLLVLVPMRARARAAVAAAAVPNNSFKPKPLRGSA